MVKRDPTPRGIDRVPLWVKVGTGLAITASALSACGSSSADKAPTPAPTTSSADITPGTTPTASATETTKDAFPASPDNLSKGRQYSELSPEQKSLIDRLDAMTLDEFMKQDPSDQDKYGQLVIDTYHDYGMKRIHDSLANTTEIQDIATFEPIPLSGTNTPDRVLYELEKNRGILNWSLTAEGSSVPIASRRPAAEKALASLYKVNGEAFNTTLKNSRSVTDLEKSDGFVASVATNFKQTISPTGTPRVIVDRLYNGTISSYVFDFYSSPDASGKERPHWIVVSE
jgi:hypothetical protein